MIGPAFRLRDHLQHIIAAIDRIGAYIEGLDHAAFTPDIKTQDAVIRNLQIIGELRRTFGGKTPTSSRPHSRPSQHRLMQ
jgi:uncharacterized protein with HEPN domain